MVLNIEYWIEYGIESKTYSINTQKQTKIEKPKKEATQKSLNNSNATHPERNLCGKKPILFLKNSLNAP